MSFKSEHVSFSHQGLGRKASLGQSLPFPYPLTVIYSTYVDVAVPGGDYATFFAMGPESFTGVDYYTTAIVNAGSPNLMSVGANATDNTTIAAPVGRWMRHALLCYRLGSNTHHDFYYDLPDLTAVRLSQTADPNYFPATGSTTFLRFADVEWAVAETLAGRFAGAKIWQAKLPVSALSVESLSPYPVLEQFRPSLWGAWRLDTVGDRLDLSGNGRHLYPSGTMPTSISSPHFQGNTLADPIFNPELVANAATVAVAGRRFWPFGAI